MNKTIIALGIAVAVVIGLKIGGRSEPVESTSQVQLPAAIVTKEQTLDTKKTTLTKVRATEKNTLLLDTDVNDQSIDLVIDRLNEMEKTEKTVYLIITSPGGGVIAGNKLIAYIENSDMEIITVCQQFCASMGFHIFESGKRRLMTAHSILMAHPASGGAQGTVPQMLAQISAIKRLTEELDVRTATRAKISYDKFEIDVLKNLWVTTNEAISMGLADGLVHISMIAKHSEVFSVERELVRLGVKIEKTSTVFPTLHEIR